MSDFIFIAATFVFFAICALYVHWCDKIIGPDDFAPGDAPGLATEESSGLAPSLVGVSGDVKS
jgi:hypothetical protein